MNTAGRDSFLIHVMNSGFNKAASSLSRFINSELKIINTQSFLVSDQNLPNVSNEHGELYVLTTQIVGDLPGKSFLILNHEESQELFRTMHKPENNDALRDAFLLEIDNILSASVIAEISNEVGIEIYGDVPQLIKLEALELQQFFANEKASEDPLCTIVIHTTFRFDKKEKVHPEFIWKLSNKIFEMIPSHKISA
jgi:chemotaxis protein CheY-P-specific phosphatase CheC